MAKDWYLMTSPYNQVSGFEGEALEDFGQEGFAEVLKSDVSDIIELYTPELESVGTFKVFVMNKIQDTELKTTQRNILLPIGTAKAGYYIKYKERFWLIVGLVDNNNIYEKAVVNLCNYLLSWVNKQGKIIQRWISAVNASQYNNGEKESIYLKYRSDKLFISMPDDDESMMLEHNQRLIIDRRCKIYEKSFDENTIKNTDNPVIVYKVTRMDNALYDYQDSGYIQIMATEDEKQEGDGYYQIDGKGYWLCKQPSPTSNTPLNSNIICEAELYDGIDEGIYTAEFYDIDGNIVDVTPVWDIQCDFKDDLNITYVNNTVMISVDNEKLVNKSFELFLSGNDYNTISKTITIKAFL